MESSEDTMGRARTLLGRGVRLRAYWSSGDPVFFVMCFIVALIAWYLFAPPQRRPKGRPLYTNREVDGVDTLVGVSNNGSRNYADPDYP